MEPCPRIAVIGAGLAGSLLCLALARRGASVLLLDPALGSTPGLNATALSYGGVVGRGPARHWRRLERSHGPLGWRRGGWCCTDEAGPSPCCLLLLWPCSLHRFRSGEWMSGSWGRRSPPRWRRREWSEAPHRWRRSRPGAGMAGACESKGNQGCRPRTRQDPGRTRQDLERSALIGWCSRQAPTAVLSGPPCRHDWE